MTLRSSLLLNSSPSLRAARVAMAVALALAVGGCVTREAQPDPILEMQVPDKWNGGASALSLIHI